MSEDFVVDQHDLDVVIPVTVHSDLEKGPGDCLLHVRFLHTENYEIGGNASIEVELNEEVIAIKEVVAASIMEGVAAGVLHSELFI